MAKNCENCKYHDVDYEWDDDYEDEVELDMCLKKHDDFLNDDEKECPYFKKYRVKKYKEPKPTMCDTCEFRDGCENVLEITVSMDSQRHFVRGRGGYCEKEGGDLNEKHLSEIMEMSDKLGFDYTALQTFKKIIKQFGDITYREYASRIDEIIDFLRNEV